MNAFSTTSHALRLAPPLALATALSSAWVHTAHAQVHTDTLLPHVVVQATGTGSPAPEIAAPAHLLDGQAWQQQRAATLGESLQGELGIHASHFGAGASRPIIRGMDGPRIGVLSHGVELHDASTISPDHAVAAEPLLTEHAEVLRGPAALVHGGAVGGVVNLIDKKIPTQRPAKAVEGTADVQWGSAAHAQTSALGLTAGQGPLVLRVEAAHRHAGDYAVGGHWRAAEGSRRVPGSASDSDTGTLGLSWVGAQGYLGAAYTRQRAQYGLPGHTHADCHLHGLRRLHCSAHDDHHGHSHDPKNEHAHEHEDEHGHGHDTHGEDTPQVDLRSHRWDVRGEWRNPTAAIEAVRLQGGHTRYAHDELENQHIATAFRNRAHDMRVEVQHAPIAGWRGVLGISTGQRHFSAEGDEGYVPASRTHKHSLFWLESLQRGNWHWQAALRHDRQRITTGNDSPQHHGTSASLGTIWKFTPGWQATASLSHAVRMPTAEELFANGLHMATNTWEIGNPQLRRETNQALDFGLSQRSGPTTWNANFYHYRIQGYIYGHTVHADQGIQLQHYTQADARFTGAEGQLRQRLNRFAGVSVFGDVVRARLANGGALPRIPAARVGLRVDANWRGWEGQAEWVQLLAQHRHTAHETRTAGFGMLNMALSYRFVGSPLELTIKAQNLTNRLGYAHTSAIKAAAPLQGRNVSVGLRMAF